MLSIIAEMLLKIRTLADPSARIGRDPVRHDIARDECPLIF
jgi:hypothetical protein